MKENKYIGLIAVVLASFLTVAGAHVASAQNDVTATSTVDALPMKKRLKLAKAGDVEAQISVARSYQQGGNGVKKSLVRAARWYRKAAQLGNADAQFALARIVHTGGKGVKKAPEVAVTLYESAAKEGHVEAMRWLAYSYQHGEGTSVDAVKAVEWYERAATEGDAVARNNLGLIYLNGEGGAKRDLARAFSLFELSAQQGNDWGLNNLAGMYEMGWGTGKSIDRAATLYGQSAELGNVHAEQNLRRLNAISAQIEERQAGKDDALDAAPDSSAQ